MRSGFKLVWVFGDGNGLSLCVSRKGTVGSPTSCKHMAFFNRAFRRSNREVFSFLLTITSHS